MVNDTSGLQDPDLAAVAGVGRDAGHHPQPARPRTCAGRTAMWSPRSRRSWPNGWSGRWTGSRRADRLDPGHDLNKNTLHTLELTRRLNEIAELGLPMLAAVSNKDFIGETPGLPSRNGWRGRWRATVCALEGPGSCGSTTWAGVGAARMIEAILGGGAGLSAAQHGLNVSDPPVSGHNYAERHAADRTRTLGQAVPSGALADPATRRQTGSRAERARVSNWASSSGGCGIR